MILGEEGRFDVSLAAETIHQRKLLLILPSCFGNLRKGREEMGLFFSSMAAVMVKSSCLEEERVQLFF